ncbi:MAG TPA: dihydroorotate dehydrogenase electron transfer subunit [Tepidisphaeraceae bacterium]|jgi:dihydroorotate dehydrogenase electron transfer subunit|nr:dihydroorotate dehydrogenase electron transfer subunit [Tepidisphaeraceae bacterium]
MHSALREQFVCTVLGNVPLCREHYRLVLGLREFPATDPGQFIQIAGRDLDIDYNPEREIDWESGRASDVRGKELMTPLAMLRRPFSLAGRRDTADGVELDIIHRVVGVGTDWMSRLNVGDAVHILGPLGNRFHLPPPEGLAILVGGGVGIPPMLYLAERLADRKAVAFCGALTRDLLPLTILAGGRSPGIDSFEPVANIGEFAKHGIVSTITTDDGSYGFRGFVTQALEKYLDGLGFGVQGSGKSRDGDLKSQISNFGTSQNVSTTPSVLPTLYTCGPEPMMKRVADIAAARGLACQIAVERAMACGMGTCQSCCIRVRKPVDAVPLKGRDWAYRLACTDGPVFMGSDLLW